jgi:exodeoxyribonuclease V beta subunit
MKIMLIATSDDEFDIYKTQLAGLTLIEASAGTGKTWTISGLYVRLVLELGLSVDQILVVTYTKAATAELQDRIRRRLRNVLEAFEQNASDDEFCRRLLAGYCGHPEKSQQAHPTRLGELQNRETALRRLTFALSCFDEAAIYTIHGFCQRLLTENAFESGNDFDCELMPDETDLLREIVDDFWRSEVYPASLDWAGFLADQGQSPDVWLQEVRAHVGKPFLKIQGPSESKNGEELQISWKKALLEASQVWHSQKKDICAQLIAYPNFNKKSIKPDHLKTWFDQLDEFFSMGSLSPLPITSQPVVLPPPHAAPVLPECLSRLSTQGLASSVHKNSTPPSHPFYICCQILVDADASLRAHYQNRLQCLKRCLLDYCNSELEQRKAALQKFSYNDLLNRLASALDSDQGERLVETIRRRYRAALIDEFQDTDPVQYRIFQRVYGHGGLPVFFVGDPKQAIYGFRGADVFSYLEARRGEGMAHQTLRTNQRSEGNLIAAINALFLNQTNPFLLEHIPYPAVQPAQRERAKFILEEEDLTPFRFQLFPPRLDVQGQEIPYGKGMANSLAAESVATEIVRLLHLSAQDKARLGDRALNGGDFAVLVATHAQARLIEETLHTAGVPSVRHGQESVYETQEASELERILLAVAEPGRETRLKAALATELMGYSANVMFALQRDETAWEALFERFQIYHQLWLTEGFMPMFRRWFEDSRITESLPRFRDGERRLTNLLHLAELLQVESRRKSTIDTLLNGFGHAIRHSTSSDETALLRLESDAQRVKIVTIHTSKGLEYPIVFCPFLWDGRLGQRKASSILFHADYQAVLDLGSPEVEKNRRQAVLEEMAEKLRLLYVALTRAVYRCYVAWGHVRNTKDKSDGFHSSALAWLLHGGKLSDRDEPLTALTNQLAQANTSCIEKDIRNLAEQAPGCISIHSVGTEATPYQSAPTTNEVTLTVPEFQRSTLYPSWRMSSFSGLTTGRHSETPDYDLLPESQISEEQGDSMFAFPRGAKAGSCLHTILEEWDFTCRDAERLAELVRRKLKAHGIEERWTPTVRTSIENLLTVSLNKNGLKLSEVSTDRRLVEMEFTYVLSGGNASSLRKLLTNPACSCDPRYAEAARLLDFHHIKGFMKGYIDLVFEAGGRYYLADYKSNWLGNTYPDYVPDRLTDAMAREHYYLQYLIYTVALHRYLQLRLPRYDYEAHFGGVYYFFIRGINPKKKTGIYWNRPNLELIAELEGILGGV